MQAQKRSMVTAMMAPRMMARMVTAMMSSKMMAPMVAAEVMAEYMVTKIEPERKPRIRLDVRDDGRALHIDRSWGWLRVNHSRR